jgi:Mg2+-importing ATPase
MRLFPSNTLPRHWPSAAPHAAAAIRVSEQLVEAAGTPVDAVLKRLEAEPGGLTQPEAERRLREYGPNAVAEEQGHAKLRLLLRALVNPLVILLLLLSTISFLTDDPRSGVVIAAMVVLGVSLRFIQEARADAAAARLKAMIHVTATVLRDGQPRELPLAQLVPGDVVLLSAGDMIPADLRLLTCRHLHVIQASLTGESFPVEKTDHVQDSTGHGALDLKNVCFLGTSVESGTAHGLIICTGRETYLGGMASAIVTTQVETSFDKGIRAFTWLMIRFIIVMVPLVFLINGFTKSNWKEAFFFAVAVAVGLTPEMLPMIVSVCLAKGALLMSHKRVIVKRLNSIQNLGAMDVLCTDKTGTLTMDRIILEKHCNVGLENDDEVLLFAYLNSHFQTGLKSLIDRAILDHEEMQGHAPAEGFSKVDEIPFDFARKVMSVVVQTREHKHRLIAKGAPEEIFKRCANFELDGQFCPMDHLMIQDLKEEYEELSANGFRVLALAYKDYEPKSDYSQEDEHDLTLRGYVAFLDPPKDSARAAITALHGHGIAVKVLTGDNELVSRKICREVGIDTSKILLGGEVEAMTDAELGEAVEQCALFARQSPADKQRIIKALQAKGHAVGYLGDGINDAPALRAADVGISVDTAVDIAKESADAILLEKNLLVLGDGVLEGRKVFANILKYIRMGASSNFGNMFSVLGASIILPYVPMQPIQILTNNLLYDFSQVPIPTDDVDPEQIAKPRPWSMNQISRFILFIGPCSSVFDYTTYFIMLYVFGCWDPAKASLFQTGWFIESLLTQTLIIHIIRTNRIPFLQSRASWPLTITTALVMMLGMWLPFSPIGPALGFTEVPPLYWAYLLATLLGYVLLTQTVKYYLHRKGWI